MPTTSTLLTFLPVVLAMQLVPGPDTMPVISRGVGQGRRIALMSVAGAVSTGLIQLPLLAIGVAALFTASPLAFETIRFAGAAFLLYTGGRLVLQTLSPARAQTSYQPTTFSSRRAFIEGFTISLLNPNVIVFMLALLPQFVDPSQGSVGMQMIVLGFVQKCSGLVVLGVTALAAGKAGDWIARHPRWTTWQTRFAGLVMMTLGLPCCSAAAHIGHESWRLRRLATNPAREGSRKQRRA
jgi:threonine/homoserine/homoserine lactone efflux protein